MLRWIRAAYCQYRYSRALLDRAYYEKELELAKLNVGVAQTRIEYWRKRLHDAEYPIPTLRRVVR